MTLVGWSEISIVLVAVIALAWPLSRFITAVFAGKKTFLAPLENALYKLTGVDPATEQNWPSYALSMLVFSALCFIALYLVQRCQGFLPLNPLSQPSVAPDLAFNTAISFITNANWQAYAGETTMSHFTQMVGLTTNNFLDSAVAIAMAVALIRAFVRREADTIGNFWVDLTRATLYVLLPLSIVVALVLTAIGTPQTLHGAQLKPGRWKALDRQFPWGRSRVRRQSSFSATTAAGSSTPTRRIRSKTRALFPT
jgi:K+-transporting ATPase ATPase A chain